MSAEIKTIAVLGTLDTKGEEHAFVSELIRSNGCQTVLIDVGTGEDPVADAALFSAIRENLSDSVELIEVDAEINDLAFSRACAETLLRNLGR